MSAFRKFVDAVKKGEVQLGNGVARAVGTLGGQQKTSQKAMAAAAEQEAQTAQQEAEAAVLKAQVMERLATLIGPFKQAVAKNGPDAPQLQSLLGLVKASAGKKQFARAAEALDLLEQMLAEQDLAPDAPQDVEAPSRIGEFDTMTIDPKKVTLAPGQTQQFKALGTRANGSQQDLTEKVVWRPKKPTVVEIDKKGFATAKASGQSIISASYEESLLIEHARVIVEDDPPPPPVATLTIKPKKISLTPGQQQPFTATYTPVDGAPRDVTGEVEWSSRKPAVVSIDNDKKKGRATAKASGTASIIATHGELDDRAIVVVEDDPPPPPVFLKPPPTRQPTLRKKEKTPDGWVEYLQQLLGVPVTDGEFDDRTFKAVWDFQEDAKKSDHTFMVDGIVGNQTWARLRGAPPEPPGTDGRKAHTFEEQGAKARWFREHEPFPYSKRKDEAWLKLCSIGNAPIESGKARVKVTAPGSPAVVKDFPIEVPPYARTPDDQGDIYRVVIKRFRDLFPSIPENAPIEQYTIEAYFLGLGDDSWSGKLKEEK